MRLQPVIEAQFDLVCIAVAVVEKHQREPAPVSGRELAAAETVDDVLGRIVASAARVLGSPKTSIWLQRAPNEALSLFGLLLTTHQCSGPHAWPTT